MKFGYVYVASMSKAFYKAAVNSAISLKDFYPEANITLFTHKSFVEERDKKYFDKIITDIPLHKRAKMWGMANTPYDVTLYIDSDTEIRSEKIKNVFDIIQENDIMFTKIISHVSADKVIDKDNNLEYHGGIILYNNKDLTKKLIQNWYDLYVEQTDIVDWNTSKFSQYNKNMKPWDQFTIWYLLFKDEKYKEIKHDFFPNGGHEYNFIYLLENNWEKNIPYKDLEQIIYHYTIPRDKVNAGLIKIAPGLNKNTD